MELTFYLNHGTGRQQCRCIVPKTVYTVKKSSLEWANFSSEKCRAELKRLINEKSCCILLVVYIVHSSSSCSQLCVFIFPDTRCAFLELSNSASCSSLEIDAKTPPFSVQPHLCILIFTSEYALLHSSLTKHQVSKQKWRQWVAKSTCRNNTACNVRVT